MSKCWSPCPPFLLLISFVHKEDYINICGSIFSAFFDQFPVHKQNHENCDSVYFQLVFQISGIQKIKLYWCWMTICHFHKKIYGKRNKVVSICFKLVICEQAILEDFRGSGPIDGKAISEIQNIGTGLELHEIILTWKNFLHYWPFVDHSWIPLTKDQ